MPHPNKWGTQIKIQKSTIMKTMVKNVRLSYVKVFEATQVNGQGDFNYSVQLLIDKNSEAAEKLKEAVDKIVL